MTTQLKDNVELAFAGMPLEWGYPTNVWRGSSCFAKKAYPWGLAPPLTLMLYTMRTSHVDSIEDRLLEELRSKFGGQPELSDSLALVGVDSVGMAELTVEIEKIYGIRVGDDVVEVESVQELADYIRQRQSQASN